MPRFEIVRKTENERGERFAVARVDGVEYSLAVRKTKRIRIPYTRRGTYGFRRSAEVTRLSDMKRLYYVDGVPASLGFERMLRAAGVLPAETK
jgi:hypothetical protein